MEKLQQLTKYDKLANDIGIADKYEFLENIKALANYNEKYKGILDDIIKLEDEYFEIEQGLDFDNWFIMLGNIYNVTTGLCLLPLYNIVCNYTHTEIQKYFDYEEMKRVIYKLYIEEYDTFIELVKQVITPSGRLKWHIVIPHKIEKLNEIDLTKTPKVPYVPKL